MEQEIFTSINGYELYYEVSNLGRIKSLARKWSVGVKKDTILKPSSTRGYLRVILCVNRVKHYFSVHKIVHGITWKHI